MFSSTNHAIQDCLCMIIYNCLNEQNRYCACLLQSSFCVFGIQSCISQLTQDKAICTCSRLLKFFHNFYLCFFQDAACKRPPWTEDHFSRGSFVWREDSTWVGVGINNQIQRGGGGGLVVMRSLGGGLCYRGLQTVTVSDKNHSFCWVPPPPPFVGQIRYLALVPCLTMYSFCG